ncbi:hypothetical protein AHAS_Ahas19G0163800 [Arachis hypogaea]
MSLPRDKAEFSNGANDFLDFAYSIENPQREKILCPCAKCCNFLWHQSVVGMDVDSNSNNDSDSESETNSYGDMEALLNDRFRDVAQAEGIKEGMNENAKKFYKLVEEASKKLHLGCKRFFTLSLTI